MNRFKEIEHVVQNIVAKRVSSFYDYHEQTKEIIAHLDGMFGTREGHMTADTSNQVNLELLKRKNEHVFKLSNLDLIELVEVLRKHHFPI